MIEFAYRAVHMQNGNLHKGALTAANENELAGILREMSLELISAKPRPHLGASPQPTGKRAPPLALQIALCEQLEDMLEAGIPLLTAVQSLIQSYPQGALRQALIETAQNLRSGTAIAQSFAQSALFKDPVAHALLKTGEASGNLPETFNRLAAQLATQQAIRKETQRALRYPAFLLCMALGVTAFMMIFVVPQLIAFLTSLDRDLPLMTRLLIGGADLFASLAWAVPCIILAAFCLILPARRLSPIVTIQTDRLLLRVPVLGPLLGHFALARMLNCLALLIHSGLTLPDSVAIAISTLGNARLEQQARVAHKNLIEGIPLSLAFKPLFPPLILQKLAIAEKSGALEKTVSQTSKTLNEQARRSASKFLGALEPSLTLLVGGILAWIVLAVLGPVYSALGPLSQGGI